MANRIRIVELTESERAVLEERARSQTLPKREVERAQIVLLSAQGNKNAEIQSALGVSRTKVQRWLDRYEEGGSKAVREDLRVPVLRPRSRRRKRPRSSAGHWKLRPRAWGRTGARGRLPLSSE